MKVKTFGTIRMQNGRPIFEGFVFDAEGVAFHREEDMFRAEAEAILTLLRDEVDRRGVGGAHLAVRHTDESQH